MRRNVGIARVQKQQVMQQKMADLGAQITAERIGRIADELEILQQQLRGLAKKYKSDIKHDPVVRARFRQISDSLGIDLISSRKNVFSGALGLGDFYYSLASKIIEACMREEKFCGSYVPLSRVIAVVQNSYDSALGASEEERTVISKEDVLTALGKLRVFGTGYNVIELCGVLYVQTSTDGSTAGDEVPLLNAVLDLREQQLKTALHMRRHASSPSPAASSTVAVSPTSTAATSALPMSTKTPTTISAYKAHASIEEAPSSIERSASHPSDVEESPTTNQTMEKKGDVLHHVGAAYVMGHLAQANSSTSLPWMSQNANKHSSATLDDVTRFETQSVALTEKQIAEATYWPTPRIRAVISRLVQNGSIWIQRLDSQTAGNLRYDNSPSTAHSGSSVHAVNDPSTNVVYWFIPEFHCSAV